MPDIDNLMQEWPADFEELLNRVGLPTADIDCTLDQYVEMRCAILDIPIYQSKIQALHVLFTLFSEFKNSQVSYTGSVFSWRSFSVVYPYLARSELAIS